MWVLVPESQQVINKDRIQRFGIDRLVAGCVSASTETHDYVLFRGTREDCARYIGTLISHMTNGQMFFNGKLGT